VQEQALFLAACEMTDPVARKVFLDRECSANVPLRRRLDALLFAHETAADFLQMPAICQIEPPSADLPAWVQLPVGPTGEANAPHAEPGMETNRESPFEAAKSTLGLLDPPTRPDSLGRLKNYEVIQVLGHGAFGVVLKAIDDLLCRTVAIKVLSTELATTSPARKRFLREARTAAAVRHENIVQIYVVDEQPTPHLVMEYIPGPTIQERIDQHGPLDVIDVVRLGHQIASGLAAAHSMGLIHRDIKPANILLETAAHDRVKITDFGLARTADDASVSQSGLIAGTPMYMSPEQALCGQVDQRADLFSLGSVLYVMASGRPPFRSSTTVSVLKRVAEDAPRPIQEIISTVPDWLCVIISKLQAKRPEDPFQSAAEVADLLAKCLADLQRGTQPDVGAFNRGKNRNSKSRRWLTLAASGLIMVSVLGATMFLNRQDSDDRQPQPNVSKLSGEPVVTAVKPTELGPLLRPEAVADGRIEDVWYAEGILTADSTDRSKNIWINFDAIQGREMTIECQLRVHSAELPGFAKLVFMSHEQYEVNAIIENHSGMTKAWIKKWTNYKPSGAADVVISELEPDRWVDLRYEITKDRYLLSVEGKLVVESPREIYRPGFVAIGCGSWKCEWKQLRTTIRNQVPAVSLSSQE